MRGRLPCYACAMTDTWLTNQFLIAMPAMGDPNFDRTVTFICEHNEDGALGLVVNRPLGMKLSDVLGQMSLGGNAEQLDEVPILRGGPVQPERGFVVHDQLGEWSSTMEVSEGIHVTTSRDILEAMAGGSGPEHALVILGYAGWAAGQLARKGEMPWRSYRLAGQAKWQVDIFDAESPDHVEAMTLAGDRLYLVGSSGELRVHSALDGKLINKRDLAVPVWDGLAVAGGRLYASTADGTVLCLGEK